MARSPAGSTCSRRLRRWPMKGGGGRCSKANSSPRCKLLDRGTPRSRLKGSWAGATGYPQFMPSAVLRLATDGDGDGVANIWRSEADGLGVDRRLSSRRRVEAQHPLGNPGAGAVDAQPRGDRIPTDRAALPAGLQAPQPVEDDARMARRWASSRSAGPFRTTRWRR